jgi:hypothetical protein
VSARDVDNGQPTTTNGERPPLIARENAHRTRKKAETSDCRHGNSFAMTCIGEDMRT